MTDQQKKQKAIAVAFAAWFFEADGYDDTHEAYNVWLLTEEGRRLTAEEPENEEEVKWLRATMETQYEAYEALAKETAQDIKVLKAQLQPVDSLTQIAQSMVYLSEHQLVIKRQLDRIEGSMKFEPKE